MSMLRGLLVGIGVFMALGAILPDEEGRGSLLMALAAAIASGWAATLY
jgi:hypothetical protein